MELAGVIELAPEPGLFRSRTCLMRLDRKDVHVRTLIGVGEPLAPVLLKSLYENYRAVTGGEQTMMAVLAVRLLATAKKDGTSAEHTDLVIHKVESGSWSSQCPTTPSASTPRLARRWAGT